MEVDIYPEIKFVSIWSWNNGKSGMTLQPTDDKKLHHIATLQC